MANAKRESASQSVKARDPVDDMVARPEPELPTAGEENNGGEGVIVTRGGSKIGSEAIQNANESARESISPPDA